MRPPSVCDLSCGPVRGVAHPIARDQNAIMRVGRSVVVQSDTRYCNPERADVGVRAWPFWWRSAMINAVWAAQRAGYEHYTYCVSECVAADASGSTVLLASAWCKIPVLADVVQAKLHDTILYLDSDAFWNSTSSNLDALGRFMWPGDWTKSAAEPGGGSFFFGCNLPWNGEDRGRRQWNRSWENGYRGPPNTGAMLLRRDAASLATLSAWWHTPFSMPRWNQKHQWEQSALWELWRTQPGFATPLRVLSDPDSGDCMRTMDRKRPSLIAHVPGGGRSMLMEREAHLQAADPQNLLRAQPWSTTLVQLGRGAQTVPVPQGLSRSRCAQQLVVGANAATVRLHPCAPRV